MNASRRFIKGTVLGLLLVSFLTITPVFPSANAAPPKVDYNESMNQLKPVAPDEAKNSEDLLKQVAGLSNKTHRLFAPLINVFAFHIGNFLGTDYIYQGAMGKMLQRIWVISRNLVNIAFVFLLLWMALKEIFFVGQETDLKKHLITFVLLMIGVNFSWLGTKVVLDAANVVTHAVFAIPSGISGNVEDVAIPCEVNGPTQPISGSCYPTAIIAPADSGNSNPLYWESHGSEDDNCSKVKKDYGGSEGAADGAAYKADGTINEGASENNKKLQKRTSICVENLNLLSYDQNTAVIYLTYGMARIQNLVTSAGAPSASQLAVSVLLSLGIQMAYTISLLALFIAMIIRMAMLWLFVAFSPFLALVIWFKGAEDKDFGEFKFGIEAFAKWAFVSAKVGAVFTVSFIMISAGQAMGEVKWSLQEKSGMALKIPEITSLFGGIGTLQSFIWLLMCLVVLWMGTFAVLNDMPIVKVITERINDYGKAVGKLVGKSPYWAPILPLGKGGEKRSVEQLVKSVDLRKKLEGYRGKDYANSEESVRRLSKTAKGVNFNEIAPILNRGFKAEDARFVAAKYGFSSPQEMLQMMKTQEKAVRSAFNESKNSENRGDALFDAIKLVEREIERGESGAPASAGAAAAPAPTGGAKGAAPPATVQPPNQPPAPGGPAPAQGATGTPTAPR